VDQAVIVADPGIAVRAARRLASDVLPRWCREREHIDDAVLVVSEVVTNAVLHGTGTIVVRLRRQGRHIRLDVQDDAPDQPTVLPLEPGAERGRGLNIVAALASRWGSFRVGRGKVVWADLPCVADPSCLSELR
jgi:anti-sigma regulatory factor (Ser/Thr protein kinase)